MPTYHLSAKQSVALALQQRIPVSERLQEVATKAGYVVGPGGIQVYPDGSVTIDADRDPSADWAVFDPMTMLTDAEREAAAIRAETIAVYQKLADGTATAADVRRGLYLTMTYLRPQFEGRG